MCFMENQLSQKQAQAFCLNGFPSSMNLKLFKPVYSPPSPLPSPPGEGEAVDRFSFSEDSHAGYQTALTHDF
jgi:hypothetical protein